VAASRPRRHRSGRCGRRPLAPFAIVHATSRPAAALAFWGKKLSVILRMHAAGGGEQDRPAGTSERIDRASDLLRRERERERVLLSE
jgi:hypothetical protein